MTTFQTGSTYLMTYIGDSNLKVPVLIVSISKTRKTAMIQVRDEKPKRCKINTYNNCEYVLPRGDYSMRPSCDANSLMIIEEPAVIEEVEMPILEDIEVVLNKINALIESTSGELQKGWIALRDEHCAEISKNVLKIA